MSVDKLRSVVVSKYKSLSEALKSTTTIDTIFIILNEHCSFFNYEILEYTIENLGDEDDMKNLKDFLAKFETFWKHKVFEVAPNTFGHVHRRGSLKEGKQSFIVVTEESMLQNFGDVKSAQHKLASMLGIHLSQLQIYRIDEG